MHKRTRACSISKKTKETVYKRDGGYCIFCGAPGLPEAHYVPRSHGGLGVEQNIITSCRPCHDKLDNSTNRQQMLRSAAAYLRSCYPDWNEQKLIYDKWHKDKAKDSLKESENSKQGTPSTSNTEKPQKDKGEPPDGFYFI